MSSDFSISEFRRRRASDNPPPPETRQLPLEMPLPEQTGPQEFFPQMAAPVIPDAVPNPYAPQAYAPQGVSPVSVQSPSNVQVAASPPMPFPAETKPKSKSLVAGLLAKFKKEPAHQAEPVLLAGPVEFQGGHQTAQTPHTYQTESPQQVPLRAVVPAKVAAVDVAPAPKTRRGVPAWAAFLLGIMTGIIMTFAALAFLAGEAKNSLEARFSDVNASVQSAAVATEETSDIAEIPAQVDPDRTGDL